MIYNPVPGRADLSLLILFIPDFTVGSGISPVSAAKYAVRGLLLFTAGQELFHKRNSPCPEDHIIFSQRI